MSSSIKEQQSPEHKKGHNKMPSFAASRTMSDPEQNIPGAYPQSSEPTRSPMSHRSSIPVRSKASKSPAGHEGHDHRPLFKVDLPTHEQPSGAREGVGSLPGPNSDVGVAILPDEKFNKDNNKASMSKGRQDHGPSKPQYDMPSSEVPSGSSLGIGSMPGGNKEAGVATLPEERVNGKPFGQGHTGFEKGLDTDWKDRGKSRKLPGSGEGKPEDKPQPTVDQSDTMDKLNPVPPPSKQDQMANPTRYADSLEHLNPVPPPSHESNVLPATTNLLAESLPSAETARNMVDQVEHVAGGALGAVGGVASGIYHRTGAPDAVSHPTETVRNIATQVEHAAEDAIGAASGAYHKAGSMLSNIGAQLPGSQYVMKKSDEEQGPNESTPRDRGSFVTSGGDAPHSKTSQRRASIKEAAPFKAVYHHRPQEYDMHGEKMDTSQFLYDDDSSQDGDITAAHVMFKRRQQGRVPSPLKHRHGQQVEPEDTTTGYGGVEFNNKGGDGNLPGYPTAQGMSALIKDRVNADRERAQDVPGSGGKTSQRKPSNKVDLPPGESALPPLSSDEEFPSDLFYEHHIVEERREVPVFQDGSDAASGKFEATFKPETSRYDDAQGSGLPQCHSNSSFQTHADTPRYAGSPSSGNLEAALDSGGGSHGHYNMQEQREVPASSHEGRDKIPASQASAELSGSPSYLGKPVTTEEQKRQIEKARLYSQKRPAGLN